MSNISLNEALEGLTVGEVRSIERHYGKTLEGGDISGTDLTVGVAWAYERRSALATSVSLPDWGSFDSWTMKQLNGYFSPEEIEVDPDDPETEAGKGDTLAA